MVVAASFMCIMVLDGIGYSFGVFLEPLHEEMEGGRGFLSIAGSMQICTYGMVSPVVASLVEKFGARIPCMFGALVSSLGLLLASYTTNIPTLILCYSVVTGVGFGLMYIPSVVIVSRHFVVHRALATGIVLCAAGVGTFVVAPIAQIWLEQDGWRGSMRGLAALSLGCIFFGAAMFPGKFGGQASGETGGRDTEGGAGSSGCLGAILGDSLASSPLLPVFLYLSLADCIAALSLYIPYTYLPGAAVWAMGEEIEKSFGAMLISAIGISNTVGRVLAGSLCDQTWSDPLILTAGVITASAPFLFLFFFISNYYLFFTCSILFGLLTGMWVSASPACLVHLLGVELLAKAFGLLTLCRGIAALCGPPMAGLAVDLFHHPGVALLVAGGGMAIASMLYLVTLIVYRGLQSRIHYTQV